MHFLDDRIIICEVSKKYLENLYIIDKNVRLKNNRKYVGILVSVNNHYYCIPITSVIRHRSNLLTVNIRYRNKIIAQLTLNNMIPVTLNDIKIINIKNEKYEKYLIRELRYLRRKNVIQEIIIKVNNIFAVLKNSTHPDYTFFKKLCVDLNILEKKTHIES